LEDAMKKSGPLIVLFAALTLLSCDPKYYTVTVENQSLKDVTYTYNDIQTTLARNSSRDYQVEAYALPPKDISVPGAMSVEMESRGSGERYVFKNVDPLALHVTNNLSVDVELRASRRIHSKLTYEYIKDSAGETTLTILAWTNATGPGEANADIYTSTPQFTVLSPAHSLISPAPSVIWEIKNNVMEVTITDQ
jgi:hypothetical protein